MLILNGLCHSGQALAQLPGMRRYTQLDGFTATNSYDLAQDARGVLWVGTDNGGMRFDGKKFRVLLEKGSFRDAEILAVKPLGGERILMSPVIGNACYLDKGTVVTARQDPGLRGMDYFRYNNQRYDPVTRAIWLSDAASLNTVYCFREKSIKRYDFNKKSFSISTVINNRFIGNIQEKASNRYRTLLCDTLGELHDLYERPGQKVGPRKAVIYAGSDPEYLVFMNNADKRLEIYRYRDGDSVLHQVKRIRQPSEHKQFTAAYIDHNRDLWLKYVGEENIWYCGSVQDSMPHKAIHFTEPGMINAIFVDKNSNLWLSSKNNALYFLSRKHFRNVLLNQRFPMKGNIPKSISGDGQGALYISYTNSSTLAVVTEHSNYSLDLGQGFEEGCRSILPAGGNYLILLDSKLSVYDKDRRTLTSLGYGTCKDACLYGTDGLLLAKGDEVLYIHSFLKKHRKSRQIYSSRATALGLLQNGIILIGTPNGLYERRSLQDSTIRVSDTFANQQNITDIQPLPGGGALIGTNARGLLLYTANGQVKEIQKGKRNQVHDIYRQNDSMYWTSTNEGVYAFTFGAGWSVKEVKNYTFYDGLPSNSATSVYVWHDTAYVATSGGLGILPLKDSGLLQMAPPDIYLEAVQAGMYNFRYPGNSLSLSRKQNSLLLSLSAISYESLGNIRYYYRLYPLQSQWVTTADADIRFAGLPPGRYIFQAYALNAKGNRSLKTISIAITIAPALWETALFRIIAAALLLLALYLLLRWWLRRKEHRKYQKLQDKKRLAELELEAIKAQINPHFIYNCLNSIQYLNYKAEYRQAQQYLDLFARLIRMTMQYSQQAFIPLQEEADYLSLYLQLEKLRFKEKLQYTIQIAEGVNKRTLLPAMLVQPYVENALKHGIGKKEKGTINITFSEVPDKLSITIEDDGPGFSGTPRQGAQGLKLAGNRAATYNELFNLAIRIRCRNRQDSTPEQTGALVTIEIMNNNHKKPGIIKRNIHSA